VGGRNSPTLGEQEGDDALREAPPTAGRKVTARVRVPVHVLAHVLVLVRVPVPALGPSTKEERTRRGGEGLVFGLHKTSRWLMVVVASVRHKSSMAYFGLEAARRLG